MLGDLHTHSNFSDGSSDAEELVFFAEKSNLTHLAISDHNTALSIEFAYENARNSRVKLIPAVELTCYDEQRQQRVHLLCYCPKLTNEIKDFFKLMAQRRNEASMKSIVELEAIYPQYSRKKVFSFTEKSGVIYKTHLIRVLYEGGYTDGIYKQLYKDLFGYPSGKVLHEPNYENVDTVLTLVKDAGGVAVLAHPTVYNSIELAKQLAEDGRIDGVEINHPRNSAKDIEILQQLAQKHDLIITGGSDFHGIHMAHPTPLGSNTTNEYNINKLIKLAQSRGYTGF